jgi:hypothetical protein
LDNARLVRLARALEELTETQVLWIEGVVAQLSRPHNFARAPTSDLVTDCVLRDFGDYFIEPSPWIGSVVSVGYSAFSTPIIVSIRFTGGGFVMPQQQPRDPREDIEGDEEFRRETERKQHLLEEARLRREYIREVLRKLNLPEGE